MAYAITQNCCSDATCVAVCPVNCIHPTPSEPDFGTAEMLYIDPQVCIDCGACADACPVDAIYPADVLEKTSKAVYVELNRDFYLRREIPTVAPALDFPRGLPRGYSDLRVAIVGTGPAAWYTADLLIREVGATVTMIDRLPVSGGLVRFGVAPDHPATKRIADAFGALLVHPNLTMLLNVEIGHDISVAELAAHHHAVIYAVGASADNTLGIEGEDLRGSMSATSFVAWYNAHPDAADLSVDLSGERAVVIGNGNVAIDVARMLAVNPERLARTEIADAALAALGQSSVREVVLLGRRGPDEASYTHSELIALKHLPDVELVVEDHPAVRSAIEAALPGSKAELLSDVKLVDIDWAEAPTDLPTGGRRIVLRFYSSATHFLGSAGTLTGVVATRNTEQHTGDSEAVVINAGHDVIPAGLVLKAIGYRGKPLNGLPFDQMRGVIPNDDGRVIEPATGQQIPGTYVVGWIKRGPSGGIGANRECAESTVDALLDDIDAGRVPTTASSARKFSALIRNKGVDAIDRREFLRIDERERELGAVAGRPRVKLPTVDALLAAAKR